MPDTVGFALGTAFLAAVLTIFGIVDRIVCGVATEIRYSIAPGLSAGLRAWGRDGRTVRPGAVAEPDDADRPGGAATDRAILDRHDPGLVVPVAAVPHRGWHLFARIMSRIARQRTRRLSLSA